MAIVLCSARRSCLIVMEQGLLCSSCLFTLPTHGARTWKMGHKAIQTHLKSVHFRSCHHPLMMLSPVGVVHLQLPGGHWQKGGEESVGRYPSSFSGKSSHLIPVWSGRSYTQGLPQHPAWFLPHRSSPLIII